MKPSRRSLTPVIFSLGLFQGYRCYLIGQKGGVWARGDGESRIDAIAVARQDFIADNYLTKGTEYSEDYNKRKNSLAQYKNTAPIE